MENAAAQVRDSLTHVRSRLRDRRLEALRNDVSDILSRNPELRVAVYLFGSWATGRFDGESDTDLLVIAPDRNVLSQAEQKFMELADDVVFMTEADWTRQREQSQVFVSRLAKERVQLVDTR